MQVSQSINRSIDIIIERERGRKKGGRLARIGSTRRGSTDRPASRLFALLMMMMILCIILLILCCCCYWATELASCPIFSFVNLLIAWTIYIYIYMWSFLFERERWDEPTYNDFASSRSKSRRERERFFFVIRIIKDCKPNRVEPDWAESNH